MYYIAEFLMPHGIIYTDGLASPETSGFKGFQVRGSLFVVFGSYFLTSDF